MYTYPLCSDVTSFAKAQSAHPHGDQPGRSAVQASVAWSVLPVHDRRVVSAPQIWRNVKFERFAHVRPISDVNN